MRLYLFTGITFVMCIAVACHSGKKTATITASPVVSTSAIPETPNKTTDGVYQPGVAELVAVQERYKDVTMSHIQQGYFLYAKDACIKCHSTTNIYKYDVLKWASLIDDMAFRAGLDKEQKKSIFFYVMSIKAAKDKEGK